VNLEDLISKNRSLRAAHAGRRCFIVANGPSLAAQDLLPMRDDVKITVTSFFKHPQARAVRPDYWVLADPYFWSEPDKYFKPQLELAQQAAVPTKLLVPTGGFACFAGAPLGPLIDLFFFHYDGNRGIDSPIDLTTGVPPFGQNVVMVCLMIAFYLGCNPIYLVGCDHDFMKTTRDEYEGMKVAHFYPGALNAASEHLTWAQWSAAMQRMTFEYEQLRAYAERWGFQVFNATRGGCLEIFPRVEYESLFAPGPADAAAAPVGEPMGEPMALAGAAIELLNGGDAAGALVLVQAALARNVGRPDRVEGLEYVKALCLARLGRVGEAIVLARQDRLVNPGNRHKSETLLAELERARDNGW
jgi:hypothetical protein